MFSLRVQFFLSSLGISILYDEAACVFVLDLNSCVKTRPETWVLILQKRVGGEQVYEDYDYSVHKNGSFSITCHCK